MPRERRPQWDHGTGSRGLGGCSHGRRVRQGRFTPARLRSDPDTAVLAALETTSLCLVTRHLVLTSARHLEMRASVGWWLQSEPAAHSFGLERCAGLRTLNEERSGLACVELSVVLRVRLFCGTISNGLHVPRASAPCNAAGLTHAL